MLLVNVLKFQQFITLTTYNCAFPPLHEDVMFWYSDTLLRNTFGEAINQVAEWAADKQLTWVGSK